MHRIAIFARRPVAGAVKQRLSPALPPALALRLYEGLLADVLAAVAMSDAGERWVYWDAAAGPGAVLPSGIRERVQAPGDLGARLAAAAHELLPTPGHRAVIVGADTLALTPAHLAAAFAALEQHDVAFAAADDGGYALVALARPVPALFENVDWSTARVLEQSLARAEAAHLRVARLAPMHDLDTPDDLARLIARLVGDDGAAGAHTRAALRGMSLLA